MRGRQGFLAGVLLALYAFLALLSATGATIAVHVLFSFFFLACVLLRLLAIRRVRIDEQPVISALDPREMPRYSVLVALYREADIVPELLVALGKLVWPRGKLEIKLVCEADDAETLAAIEAQELRPLIEVIRVPKGLPRTKPKALAHALQMISGDYVALYDAEDRPHPLQLVEAWQRFQRAGADLACVQAPLVISNQRHGLLARMFAFEYSGLFRGMLPFLARNELVLPLGGTSNHFRRDILDRIGGWDPYNVTEDADLGLRLKRFGFRTETISLPTREVGPETLSEWLPQRTRWFKGWIQTWLVHMRDPGRLYRELGLASFVVSQILFSGMVVSALAHPLLLVTLFYLAYGLFAGWQFATYHSVLLGLDLANIALGYLAFLLLGRSTLSKKDRRHFPLIALFTPLYWMLLSIAAWRALWQLYWDPHLWEKTPHPVGRYEEEAVE
jgi:cellulose synthase/poly-beta-1,6-N-acetylglucosamine synthase-like glycosyltransferase